MKMVAKDGAPTGNQNAKKEKTTKKQPKNNQKTTKKQPNENENENENENIKKESVKEKSHKTPSGAKAPSGSRTLLTDIAKANEQKHKYGKYKHVSLKDEELQALKRDYANWEELIMFLDEYIEMKGYKAKSHYLCIRKWVAEAVRERKIKNKSLTGEKLSNTYHCDSEEFENFYMNCEVISDE